MHGCTQASEQASKQARTHMRVQRKDGRLPFAVNDVGVVHVDKARSQVVSAAPARYVDGGRYNRQ